MSTDSDHIVIAAIDVCLVSHFEKKNALLQQPKTPGCLPNRQFFPNDNRTDKYIMLPLRAYWAQLGRSTCAKVFRPASINEIEMVQYLEYHVLILYEAHNDHFAAA